jgi:hypothetical protein
MEIHQVEERTALRMASVTTEPRRCTLYPFSDKGAARLAASWAAWKADPCETRLPFNAFSAEASAQGMGATPPQTMRMSRTERPGADAQTAAETTAKSQAPRSMNLT